MWQPPRPLAKATDAAAACGVWQPVSIRSHIPFSRDRLPHGDGLARPARIATAGSPAHACHKGTAAATRFESPLRDYPAPPMRQHPEPAAAWGLGASAHRDPKPIPFFVPGCHMVSLRAFLKGRFPARGSASGATAATRGVWQHKRRRLPRGFAQGIFQRPVPHVWQRKRGRLPRGFAEGISQRPVPHAVWQHRARDGCHAGRVAAQAQTAATRFRRGHFPKAGSQRGEAAQAVRRLPHVSSQVW